MPLTVTVLLLLYSPTYPEQSNTARPLLMVAQAGDQKTLSEFDRDGCLIGEMLSKSDAELLREYADHASEKAFAEIVRRYTDLVYSAAWRQVDSADLARDVAQSVFIDLARKARSLAETRNEHSSLVGWLYRATRFAASNMRRGEYRRQSREKLAMEHLYPPSEAVTDWERVRPALDEAMSDLDDEDREAVLLRFFKNEDLRTIGVALGITDDAAQKRISRALDRLHAQMTKRGVTTTAIALSTALAANAVQAAPVGLAATISSTALAGAGAGGGALTTLKWIAATKLQAGVVGAVVAASAVGSLLIERQSQASFRQADTVIEQQANQLERSQAANAQLSNRVAEAANMTVRDDLDQLRLELADLRSRTNGLEALQQQDRELLASLAQAKGDVAVPASRLEKGGPVLAKKINYAKQFCLGAYMYMDDHKNHFPTNFADIAKYLPPDVNAQTNLFEIVLQGAITDLDKYAHPEEILLIREREPWKDTDGIPTKVYGCSDGHFEVHTEADGDFAAWEQRRIVPPAASTP